MTPFEALQQHFGYSEFRPAQKEIIDAILNNENVLAVLPTGAGKSLCYQIPALISESFSIVISPLIALMKDQVDNLNRQFNIAAFINSSMSFRDAEEVLQNIAYGKTKLLYIAPERLDNVAFAERIKALSPSFVFVDEAHCISEWGHNFRPSYTRIKDFIKFISVTRTSAFTATATPEVVQDIVAQLNLKDPRIFVKGFERNNLYLNVVFTKQKNKKCIELVKAFKTPAIIYCASRKKAEEASEFVNLHKIKCGFYHAGLQQEIRKKVQEDFLNDKLQVIAATNAFGMGIDKKDIRLIIHYNIPGSIENYYQEIGRAGRDGEPSYTFLLFDEPDINIQNYFISSSNPDRETICGIYDALCDFGRVAEGSMSSKEIPVNLDFISSCCGKEINKGLLHSALKILAEAGYLKLLNEYEKRTSIHVLYEKNKLREFIESSTNSLLKEAILLLLRKYGSDLFTRKVHISIPQLAAQQELTESEFDEAFTILDNLGIINYNKSSLGDSIVLTVPRVNSKRLNLDYKKINENFIRLNNKLDKMVQFAYYHECRFKYILEYFGAASSDYTCGKCDKCSSELTMPESSIEYIKEIILRTIYLNNDYINETTLLRIVLGTSGRESNSGFDTFGSLSGYQRLELKETIGNLVSSGYISRDKNNTRVLILSKTGYDFLSSRGLIEDEVTDINYDEHLEIFNTLRQIRKAASQKFMQAAYLICPDDTLREIVFKRPKNQAEFLSVKGTNERMYFKIGEEMISAINLLSSDKPGKGEGTGINFAPDIKETYNLVVKGFSLKDIASLRKLNEAVISLQIETIIEYNPEIDIAYLFPDKIFELIGDEIRRGYKDLKELKSRLPVEVSYSLIRIAAAKLKASSSRMIS